jgi:hypothetical protein
MKVMSDVISRYVLDGLVTMMLVIAGIKIVVIEIRSILALFVRGERAR